MRNEHVKLQDVTKSFGDNDVLRGVSMEILRSEIFAIIGPSGSGKTTLLRLINMLEIPDSGKIFINGRDLSKCRDGGLRIRREMAMVLQKPVLFKRSVFENVAYGLRIRGFDDDLIEEKVDNALRGLGLKEYRERRALSLSGGEAQRLAFARVLVLCPKLLLLDEFTANLDPSNVKILEEALIEYNKEKRATVIIVTHNLAQAKRVADRVAFLLNGEIVEIGEKDEIFSSPESEKTRAFIEGEMVY